MSSQFKTIVGGSMDEVDIKKLAVACAFLEGIGAQTVVEERFSQDERDLIYNWFNNNWDASWDSEMIEYHLKMIAEKINELKGE